MAIAITTATTIAITIATTAAATITMGTVTRDLDLVLQLHPQLTADHRLGYTIFVHRWLTLRHTIVTERRNIVTTAAAATTTTTTPTAAGCDLDEGHRWRPQALGGRLITGASDLRDTL